jgi:integrase
MLRTRSGLPKHCSWNTDRHGKRRVRFRRRGVSTYLTGIPWGEDFMRAYAAVLEGVQATGNVGVGRTIPGSVNALCVSYYRSPEFRGLKPSTQMVRKNIIEAFRAPHGDKPIDRLERRHIADIIGAKAEKPEAANNLLKVLRVLFDYAIGIDMIKNNPAIGVKRYPSRRDGFHCWSESEAEQFEAAHPVSTTARLAYALAAYTGQRVGDLVRMGWQHVKGDKIAVRQEKTGKPLLLTMHPELVRVLATVPKDNLTFLLTPFGKPFTPAGLSNWFGKRCREAGLQRCSAHGLRKLALTRRANAGASTDMLKAFGGHKTSKEVDRYTREADQARLDECGLELQLRAERERNLVQPKTRLDKQS